MPASDKPKPRPRSPTPEVQLAEAQVRIRKLEADVENLKSFGLGISSRVLRLELAVSSMDTDNKLRSILYPEPEAA